MLQIFLYDSKALSLLHCDASGIWMISHAICEAWAEGRWKANLTAQLTFFKLSTITRDWNEEELGQVFTSYMHIYIRRHASSVNRFIDCSGSNLVCHIILQHVCMLRVADEMVFFNQMKHFTFILWAMYLVFIAIGNLNISPSNPSSFQFHVLLLI